MKVTQAKDEIPEELRTRATKLSALAFHEEAKENVAIQVHLADLYVDELVNKRIRHDLIRGPSQIVGGHTGREMGEHKHGVRKKTGRVEERNPPRVIMT